MNICPACHERTENPGMCYDCRENLNQLREEREALRINLNSGLCSPDLANQFEHRLAMLDEGLEAFEEQQSLKREKP